MIRCYWAASRYARSVISCFTFGLNIKRDFKSIRTVHLYSVNNPLGQIKPITTQRVGFSPLAMHSHCTSFNLVEAKGAGVKVYNDLILTTDWKYTATSSFTSLGNFRQNNLTEFDSASSCKWSRPQFETNSMLKNTVDGKQQQVRISSFFPFILDLFSMPTINVTYFDDGFHSGYSMTCR